MLCHKQKTGQRIVFPPPCKLLTGCCDNHAFAGTICVTGMINVEVDTPPSRGIFARGLKNSPVGGQLDLGRSWSRGSVHFWRKASSLYGCTTGISYLSHQQPKSLLQTFAPEELIQPTLKRGDFDQSWLSHQALPDAVFKSFEKYLEKQLLHSSRLIKSWLINHIMMSWNVLQQWLINPFGRCNRTKAAMEPVMQLNMQH